ncbi:hypothetical protein ZWY2020_003161 [Hordeum vulgare]|nr:hypothetical protein ZWY2020_003161 [Hordeum vulgare]
MAERTATEEAVYEVLLRQRTLSAGKLTEKVLKLFLATECEEIILLFQLLNINQPLIPVLPTNALDLLLLGSSCPLVPGDDFLLTSADNLIPSQCLDLGSLHHCLSILQEHLDMALKGGVSRHP